MYDPPEPPEPDYDFTPPEPAEKPVIDLKVSNYDLARMIDHALAQSIERHVKRAIEKWVEKKVATEVGRLVEEISTGVITAAVEKALTEGWGKVNQWGEPVGERFTLATTVRDALLKLDKRPERGFHDKTQPQSQLEEIITAMAADGVKTGLMPILEEAKQNLRSTLDVQLGKGLRLTLADVLKG